MTTKQKVEGCSSNLRPDFESAPRKENVFNQTMPQSVESVKRDPWIVLELLRADLKVIVAHLSSPDHGTRTLAYRRALTALHRVGMGELSEGSWS